MVEFNIFNIFIWIILLFFVLLFVKQFFSEKIKNKFCVICITITLTWIILLIIYWMGYFEDKLIIGLLMGCTIIGVYYIVEKKMNRKYSLFRLPFLLTLIFIGYNLIGKNIELSNIIDVVILLVILWILFLFLLSYHKNKTLNRIVNKIVECCKKW